MRRLTDPLAAWLRRKGRGCDIWVAAAVYDLAGTEDRTGLARILFATMRDRLRLADAPFTPPAVLAALAQLDDARLNRRPARHERTPGEALARIRAASPGPGILAALAAHPGARPALLAGLPRAGKAAGVRRALAGNPACPAPVLEAILPLASPEERKLMAANPAARGAVLRALMDRADGDAFLRGEIANPACPADLRKAALGDPSALVRRRLAANPQVGAQALIALFAGEQDIDVLSGLGRNGATPHAWLERIASDNADLRRSVILNPCASGGILLRLAEDPCPFNRLRLAENLSLPAGILAGFLNDPEPRVRFRAAARLARECTETRKEPAQRHGGGHTPVHVEIHPNPWG